MISPPHIYTISSAILHRVQRKSGNRTRPDPISPYFNIPKFNEQMPPLTAKRIWLRSIKIVVYSTRLTKWPGDTIAWERARVPNRRERQETTSG